MGKQDIMQTSKQNKNTKSCKNGDVIRPKDSSLRDHNHHHNLHVHWVEESIVSSHETSDSEHEVFRRRACSDASTKKSKTKSTKKSISKTSSNQESDQSSKTCAHSTDEYCNCNSDGGDNDGFARPRSYSDGSSRLVKTPKPILKHRQTCVVVVHTD